VHAVAADGSLSLHARSLEFGRLENGRAVAVPAALVARVAAHFFTLRAGVDVMLGLNGVVWLCAASEADAAAAAAAAPAAGAPRGPRGVLKGEAAAGGGDGGGGGGGAPLSTLSAAADAAEEGHAEAVEAAKRAAAARDIDYATRLRIARAANACLALAAAGLHIHPDAIMSVYDESLRLGQTAAELADARYAQRAVETARKRAAPL
jgi:hypothetical protein